MATWNLTEVASGLVVKSDHVKNASNNWQGDVAANGNNLSGVATLNATRIQSGVNSVSFSATPTFDASAGNVHTITLTGNVTSSTVSNLVAGQHITFVVIQDGTGSRTFVWPTNMYGAMAVGTAASSKSVQTFVSPDGSNLYSCSFGQVN